MIYVTGDYHGGIDGAKLRPENFPEGASLTRDDCVVVCGDFGMPWTGSNDELAELAWLASQPWTTAFVDGNHECFSYYDEQPEELWHGGRVHRFEDYPSIVHLMRGQVFELDGARVFTMGGATSVDRAWRVPGLSWFPEELPSRAEYEEAERNLGRAGWRVDYVLTHTCASSLLPRALYPDTGWQAPDTDELTGFFESLEERLDYRRWYFGHFHKDRDIDDRHTLLYRNVVRLGDEAGGARGRR